MGLVPLGDTHHSRPTGKLIAARWMHEHLRLILLSAILSFALTIFFLMLLHRGASAMSVTVVDGGRSTVIETRSSDVQSLLEERGIVVGPYDQVSQPLDADIDEGSTIVIHRAASVTLIADGSSAVNYTTAKTVRDALSALNVQLSSDDKLYPDPDTAVYDGMRIRVVRVEKQVREAQYPLEFTVVEQKDGSLEQGKQRVVQSGQVGKIVKKFEKIYEDGQLVSSRMLSKSVAADAVPKIVAVGTKKKAEVAALSYDGDSEAAAAKTLKLNGKTIKVKRVLNNVTLTAYSAGPASTGKDVGDPGYGITASGAKVSEGRTISVDPDVIPLGWWVYIEGIGFRRAEDTGSAIKGKKIDVYYDSEKYANKFGTKRGYTVYVVGPVKPSAA